MSLMQGGVVALVKLAQSTAAAPLNPEDAVAQLDGHCSVHNGLGDADEPCGWAVTEHEIDRRRRKLKLPWWGHRRTHVMSVVGRTRSVHRIEYSIRLYC